MVESKVWYLAAGQKKVGPLSSSRVLERVAQGKVPAEARVWRDGMAEWLPIHEVEELKVERTVVPAPASASGEARRSGAGSQSKSGSGERPRADASGEAKVARETKAVARTPKRAIVTRSSSRTEAPFVPPHRIERRDLWRAFALGLDRRRVAIVLCTVVSSLLVLGALVLAAKLAGKLHVVLALPFLLAGGLGSFCASAIGLGALSYHSRRQVEGAEPPTVGEAFGHAFARAGALTLPPLLLSVAWLVPLVLLVAISLLVKVPYLGPVGTGALFGVHIALGGLTLYLLLTAGVASTFSPVVVGFEGGGVMATFRTLLDFARRSTVRVVLWSVLPSMAFTPFAGAVLFVTALTLALPLLSVGLMAGQDVRIWFALDMTGDCPLPGLTLGLVPMALWIGLTLSAALAVLGSVANSLLSLLYVAGRPGNDERPTRDAWIAARTLKTEEN